MRSGALQHPIHEAHGEFDHLFELAIQDDGVGRMLQPVHLCNGRADSAADYLTTFRMNRGVQAALDDEDWLADAGETVDYFSLHVQELHPSAQGADRVALPALTGAPVRLGDRWHERSKETQSQPVPGAEAQSNGGGICEHAYRLGMLAGQVERRNSTHRLPADKDALAASGKPLEGLLSSADPILPTGTVEVSGRGAVPGQERPGHSISHLVQPAGQRANLGRRSRQTVGQEHAGGASLPKEGVAFKVRVVECGIFCHLPSQVAEIFRW